MKTQPTEPIIGQAVIPAAISSSSNEMVYLPAGVIEGRPTQKGKVVNVQLHVTRESATALEQQRAAIVAAGKRPYFDFNHDDKEASFWPAEFLWREGEGVIARGEWSRNGADAIEGKAYRGFSPICHVDDVKKKPARIVCRSNANPNMGGLVNNQAFKDIPPFFAKAGDEDSAGAAGQQPNQNNTADTMNEQEQAALRAKNLELQKEIDALKAKDAALKAKDETDATIASELKAKEAEIKSNATTLENEALKAKGATMEAAIKARNKADAEAVVADAVKRGAIAAKDTKTSDALVAKATEDPAFLDVIKAMQGNAALGNRITAPATTAQASNVSVSQISGKEALQAYGALVAKNAAIKNPASPDKAKLAKEAAAIYDSELKGKEDAWMGVPLEEAIVGADVTSAAIGTLAGTLVLQRNLPLLKFNYPMLRTLFTDFSDATGLWQQTEVTRIPIKPAVTEYDATLDANGRPKGFVVVTPAQSVDVPITLSKHVGIPMIFGVQTLASTVRNLFAEQSAGAISALGGYFVNMATALMTAANFNAYKQITDAACGTTSGSTAITLASTAGVYKGQEISGTGIPAGAHIASVTDATNAVMTLAATATATVTATLGGGRVPTLYPTYVKALADFNFASLGEIGAAFDNNEVPYEMRSVMLNASYYAKLTQDPTVNNFFAATRAPDIISKGLLPELNGFVPQKAPFFPTSSSRVGFAYHPAAIALKSRLPQDFTRAVSAMVPGSVTTVTDPDTGISVLLVERVDLTGSYAESRIEVMLGAALGDPRAGLVLTSQ